MNFEPFGSGGLEQFSRAPSADDLSPALARSLWAGAKSGMRTSKYVAGTLAVLVSIPCLVLTFFAAGSGRGWGVPAYFNVAWAFCGVSMVAGGLVGAAVGLARGILTRLDLKEGNASNPTAIAPEKGGFYASSIKETTRDGRSTRSPRKLLRWLVGAFSVLVLLVYALAFRIGIYAGDKVDREIAAATAAAASDDPHWRIDDILVHRVPVLDTENSALLVTKAAAFLPKYGPDGRTPIHYSLRQKVKALSETPENVRIGD
jgi:hypothetical protein